jgi:ABC-type nitrate/sulfonate/bicarbonate transport system permease component
MTGNDSNRKFAHVVGWSHRAILQPLTGVVGIALAWQTASILAANPTLVPSLPAIGRALREIGLAQLAHDIGASLSHLAVGFGLGAATGLSLALAAGALPVFRVVLVPYVEFFRPISAIAWIPIAILLFGVGRGVPIFLIFYASVFPILVSTLDGIRRVDPALVNAARSLGASRALVTSGVILPATLPSIMAGARLSLGVGWVAMVAGELVGADAGLGWRILWHQEFFSMDGVMATIVVIGVIGWILDAALFQLQSRLLHWSPPSGGRS